MRPAGAPALPTGEPVSSNGFSIWAVIGSVGLGLGVLAVIGYYTFEADAFAAALLQVNPWLMLAAAGCLVLRVLFGAWRLQYVAHGRFSFTQSLRGQLAWDFFSNVTPSALGGGPFAAVYVAKDRGIPIGEASAILLFTMLLDQLWTATSTLIVIAGAFYVDLYPEALGRAGVWGLMAYFAGTLIWTVIFGYATLFRPHWIQQTAAWFTSFRLTSRFRRRALRESSHLKDRALLLRSRGVSFYFFGYLLSVGAWISRYAMLLFMVWAVYPLLDRVLFFLRTIAMTLGSLILPTPGGAGGIEGFYYLFMRGVMPDALLAPTLFAWRLFGYYIFIAAGIYLTMHGARRFVSRRLASTATSGDGVGKSAAPELRPAAPEKI